MNIEARITGFIEENCYFIFNPDTRQTVVIDPGDDAPQLLARLRERDGEYEPQRLHEARDHYRELALRIGDIIEKGRRN